MNENSWTIDWMAIRLVFIDPKCGRWVLSGGVPTVPDGLGIQRGQAAGFTSPVFGSGRPQPKLSGAITMSQPVSAMAELLVTDFGGVAEALLALFCSSLRVFTSSTNMA